MTEQPPEIAPGAYVAHPYLTNFAEKQLSNAAEALALEMFNFVDFLQLVNSELERYQATLLAAGLIKGLPQMIMNSPGAMEELKKQAQRIKEST